MRHSRCVISSFITKPQPARSMALANYRCVISSFITKPQRSPIINELSRGCVISSFITKPQPHMNSSSTSRVALYPLSSPNHNGLSRHFLKLVLRYILFHHQTTTVSACKNFTATLRYILFHHQTTTQLNEASIRLGCVISSFITKPQPCGYYINRCTVALYPLSSPNHNQTRLDSCQRLLRYILFHHQTTTVYPAPFSGKCCVISSFITKPQLALLPCLTK